MNCPRCFAAFSDPELNFCGKCGARMRQATGTDGDAPPSTGGDDTLPTGGAPAPSAVDAARLADDGPDLHDPLVGAVIDTRYRVLARIGSGGMGAVYKVEHVAMGKIAAL